MLEEKQPDVINDGSIPESRLGLFIYIGDRFKRSANQLTSSIRNIFNPVFTHDADDEALLENDALSKESENCKESSSLAAPLNDVFDAEYEEELKKAKMNIERHRELLKPPETVNASIPQKIHDTNTIPQLDNLSERIKILLEPLNKKICSLAQERGVSAALKAGLLAKIRTRALTLQAPPINKSAFIQSIIDIRKSIIENQDELSNYRSKWGSSFFFGTMLRMNLAKRVTSKTLIKNLMDELNDIEKATCGKIYSPKILLGIKNLNVGS